MSNKNLTREEVSKAKAQLEQDGKPVTIRGIHTQLGRGSFATILKFLKPPDVKMQGKESEMPDSFVTAFAAGAKSAWAEAQRQNQESISNVRKDFEQNYKELNKLATELSVLLGKAHKEKDKLTADLSMISRLNAENQAKKGQSNKHKEDIKKMMVELKEMMSGLREFMLRNSQTRKRDVDKLKRLSNEARVKHRES